MEKHGASAPAKTGANRTFFVTAGTSGMRSILQSDRMAGLLVRVIEENRTKGRFRLHAYVIMPDHIHLLFTPDQEVSLEKCVQYVKGGFSFRVGKELGSKQEIWQAGFNEHWIKDAEDFRQHVQYIHMNPVRKRLVGRPEDFVYSSIAGGMDPMPEGIRG